MTVEQLARSTRSVFEQHYESLTGLPFFTSFPLNCCQGASVCSGQLNPDTWLGRSSAFAGGIPSLC